MATFKDKVALITGGSRGLGFALARGMAARGAQVAITARTGKRLEDSKQKLESEGAQVLAIEGDVGARADAQRMIKETLDRFGRIDVVVNNAGVSMAGEFKDVSMEVVERVVTTNLMGCLYTSRLAVDELIKNRGSLTFISSIVGLFGMPNASIYCATKKALSGLTESLRIELIPHGVHVGIVYLGFTEHDPEKRILNADGSGGLPDRPAHHTQAEAAAMIIRMIERRKKQLVMTPAGVAGYLAYRISPTFLEKAALFAQSRQWGTYKKFSQK
jgi:NAD(P)-dependent dehydrogenase (short-subunit alcohol dehydrogenase family)